MQKYIQKESEFVLQNAFEKKNILHTTEILGCYIWESITVDIIHLRCEEEDFYSIKIINYDRHSFILTFTANIFTLIKEIQNKKKWNPLL